MLLDLLCYKWHSMSQMVVIPHRFKNIGVHNLVVRRIFSDILLVLRLKKVEKHCSNRNEYQESSWGGKGRPARKADLTALCEATV
jgi:hypothetical protein